MTRRNGAAFGTVVTPPSQCPHINILPFPSCTTGDRIIRGISHEGQILPLAGNVHCAIEEDWLWRRRLSFMCPRASRKRSLPLHARKRERSSNSALKVTSSDNAVSVRLGR